MIDILLRAGSFVGLIFLGYFLRLLGIFKKEDVAVIARVVLKITLPAAIIVSLSGYTIAPSMLTIALVSLAGGGISVLTAALLYRKKGKERRAFAITNVAGYNVGCFTMPFAQCFLGPVGVATTNLFDAGNSFFCLGGGYSIAVSIKDGDKFSFTRIFKTVLRSVPFVVYLIMIALNFLHLRLPAPVLSFVKLAADANPLMAMLMIGVGIDLHIRKEHAADVVKILLLRYGVATILSAIAYFLLPFGTEIRKALVILLFSPIGSTAVAYTEELKSDVALSSTLNSISILCSIVIMVCFLSFV